MKFVQFIQVSRHREDKKHASFVSFDPWTDPDKLPSPTSTFRTRSTRPIHPAHPAHDRGLLEHVTLGSIEWHLIAPKHTHTCGSVGSKLDSPSNCNKLSLSPISLEGANLEARLMQDKESESQEKLQWPKGSGRGTNKKSGKQAIDRA